jgi:hypothetical protein
VRYLHWQTVLEYDSRVSPTVFRDGGFRFYFFSREETRLHVHVSRPDGEAKFWLEPRIELAENHGIPAHQVTAIVRIVKERSDELTTAWHQHFGD